MKPTYFRASKGPKFTVNNEDRTGILICDDGNGTVVVRECIPFTDFPLRKIKLYFH